MKRTLLAAIVAAALIGGGCANHRAPILVGQSALAVSSSIERLSTAGRQLEQASIISAQQALGYQRALLAVNEQMKPLPELLRTVDRLQQAGDSTASETDRAIAILQVVGQDISVVVAGIPVSEATRNLIDLIRAAQKTVSDVLVEVAKIRGGE